MTLTPNIMKLDQFLKWVGAAQTGGEAKIRIQSGDVRVNGVEETRRGRKLVAGDRIALDNQVWVVTGEHLSPNP